MILITNDDGIQSPGIYALYQSIKEIDDVVVVAPETEMSAVGHAITISDPLRVKEIRRENGFFGYAVSGTPADCVKIALKSLLKQKPDLVLSGINQGANVGTNVIYSGTVSAATEGTILGIPSVALSLDSFLNSDFSFAAAFAKKAASLVKANGLPGGTLLNINIPAVPANQIRGVAVVPQGKSRVVEEFVRRTDPRQHAYYWQAGEMVHVEEDEGSDSWVLRHHQVAITPIHYDLTDYRSLELLRSWEFDK